MHCQNRHAPFAIREEPKGLAGWAALASSSAQLGITLKTTYAAALTRTTANKMSKREVLFASRFAFSRAQSTHLPSLVSAVPCSLQVP